MINVIILVSAIALAGYLNFSKKLKKSSDWSATVTPLASIMGSGFLVSAPLLGGLVGGYAVICISILLVIAYTVGGVIRFNIQYFEPLEKKKTHEAAHSIALLSRLVLAGAYFISVSYYLQLLAVFSLSFLGYENQTTAHIITTVLLTVIGSIGILKGLSVLEKVEKYAVSLNLAVIGSLLLALVIYNIMLVSEGNWHLPETPSKISIDDFRILLGLLIVVQGFETSRYLGDEHSPEQRIRTMKFAQLISSIIYVSFISLTTVLFHDGLGADVTAIIQLTAPIAVVLPLLISFAAIGSQFSAAVADNAGAGGLLGEISGNKIPLKYAYLLIFLVTVMITWETNVNQIISFASRAFALFYFLQCLVAAAVVFKSKSFENRNFKIAKFLSISVICLIVFLFGLSSE
ncbi:MAG: hypothetical protein NE334_11210 [Lentisphaeraceae bacterium]|nr:hypothetical protein [Lentisphaeraceae bacterium]